MGYSHYFYKIAIDEIDAIKDMSRKQLVQYAKEGYPNSLDMEELDVGGNDKYVPSFYGFLNKTEVFDFGKLYYDDTADRIYEVGKPLFSQNDTQNSFSDYVPYVVGKQGVLKAMEIYRQKTISHYKNLLKDDYSENNAEDTLSKKEHISKEEKQVSHAKAMLVEWEMGWAVNTDEKDGCLTNSWKYEYRIFELARLLKTIDWNKDTILFFGR